MRKNNTNEQPHTQHQFRLKPAYAAVLLAFTVQTVEANPLDPTVVRGQASFASSGSSLTVTNTPGTIINWQGFSIGANEITRFNQQSASSAVLNRVISSNPSSILGTLQSNGRVFLINPNGIVFGAGSVVDVAGLVASTLKLSDDDFLAGRNRFTQIPGAANVSNAGDITAQNGGQIFLIAPNVENTGVITAPNGEILLAAGHSVDLVSTSDPDLRVSITAPAGDATNVGKLIASSGSLGLFGTVVRNSGTVSANSATMQGGKIIFRASQRAEISGAVSATGVTGGDIQILGNQVALIGNAGVDASGNNGGGTVLIGGDAHGANPAVQNAQQTFVSSDANIKADAVQNGNGGKVVVWADGATQFRGNISAQGGVDGGDGGWVEVSGKQWLVYAGLVDTRAAHGLTGSLLLDPTDITISTAADTVSMTWTAGTLSYADIVATPSNLNVITLQNQLGLTNVTVDTSSALAGTGNITVQDSIVWNSVNSLTLNAAGTGTITVNALNTLGAPLQIANSGIGALSLISATNIILGGDLVTTGGNVLLNANTAGAGGAIVMNSGSFITSNGGNVTFGGGSVGNGTGNAVGNATYASGIDILGASINSGAGNITLNGQGYSVGGSNMGVYLHTGASLTSTSGNVTINGTGGAGINLNYGVWLTGIGTSISSVDGNISVIGNGAGTGPSNNGIRMDAGASVISTGLAAITLNGTGSSTGTDFNYGVLLGGAGTLVQSASGNITVTGQGTGVGTGTDNYGVYVRAGADVISTGAATITLNGTGGAGTSWNYGVWLTDAGTSVSSVNGNISITGAGTGSTQSNDGVRMDLGVAVTSTGTAAITVNGTGGAGTDYNYGVLLADPGTVVQSATGNISITGQGQGSGLWDYGILLRDAASVTSTGSANITLDGRGAGAAQGIYTSTAGANNIIGGATSTGNITLIADTVTSADSIFLSGLTISGTGNLLLEPLNAATTIGLAGGAGTFNLDATELATIQLGFASLTIGRVDGTGLITFGDGAGVGAGYTFNTNTVIQNPGFASGGINISDPFSTGLYNLTLNSGGNLNVNDTVSANIFTLGGGIWNQVAAILPGFTVNDFRITGGTFIRALGGDGSVATPYLLTDIYGVQGMGSALSSAYALANNIDASGTVNWNAGAGFVPVGTYSGWPNYGTFIGQLDGQGRTISNLKINRPSESYVGLFGGLGWGAVVSNVGLVSGSVSGLSTVGALAAYNYGSISNSYVSGMNISGCGSCSNIGGLVGVNDYNITSSYVSGGSISGGWYVGGLVGHNWSATIDSSYVIGGVGSSISGSGAVGGLVGWNGGNIINGSYVSAGNVSGGSSVGGLVGKNTDFGSISNSYVDTGTVVTGNVSVGGMLGWDSGEGVITGNTVTDTTVNGNSFVGGLIGKYSVSAWSSVAGYTDNNQVINSFVDGGTVSGLYVGGLVGWNGSSLSNSSVSGTTVTGLSNVGGLVGYNATANSFVSGSAVSYRNGYISNSYVNSGSVTGTSAVGGLVGANNGIISNSHYNINGVLINAVKQVTRYGLYNDVLNISGIGQYDDWFNGGLMTPLVIADYAMLPGSAGSHTINSLQGMKALLGFAEDAAYTFSLAANVDLATVPGYYIPYLAANFDGANFTISNLNLTLNNNEVGLFGHIAMGSTVSNVKLLNAAVTGYWSVGALAGYNEGDIFNSNSTGGTVIGSSFVGGLVGRNIGGNGGVAGQSGGAAGLSGSAATISDSYVSGGTVSGVSNVGGLVGQNLGGDGGAGGYIYSGIGSAGGNGGAATISGSYVSGTTVNGDSNAGGLVGQSLGGSGGAGGNTFYGTGGAGGAGGAATISGSYVSGVTTTANANNIGGLAGSNASGVAGAIGSVLVTGGVAGVGGAAGAATIGNSYVSGGTITSTYTSGSSGVFLGGLAGYNGGIISNSYVSGGSVVASLTDGTGAVGGLAGYNTGTISNTYVSGGTVNGNGVWEIGGLVGVNAVGGNISYSYAATGMTSGWGQHEGLVSNNDGVVSNSIWDADLVLSGIGWGSGTATVTGLTTAQMKNISSFVNAGWNIASTGGAGMTWRIYEGYTAPLLTSFLKPLTVTANNATKTYDANPYTGGNGVTPSIVGAVVLGTPIYGGTSQGAVNANSYVITASGLYSDQLGYDISYVDGVLTITPAAATLLSVTAKDASKTYGTTLTFAGTEFTPVGLLGNDAISGVTLTSAGAVNTANAGTYAITPSAAVFSAGSASNYTLTYVDGVLTVTPLDVTIAADASTKVYGDADAITFTASGLMSWDTNATAFTGALSHTGGENVGTYAINAGTLASTNYTFTGITTNNLIITPAPLTVTANDANKILNTPDPLLTYMVAGLKLSDTSATTLNGELSRVAGETVGNYPINQGTLALTSTNYTMTYVPGRFTILVPTVIDEIVNTSLLFSPDTGSSQSTSSDEEDRLTEEVVVVADTTTDEGTAAPPLPVCN